MNRLVRRLVRTATVSAATCGLFACHGPADEFRSAVPSTDVVSINVPAKSTAGLSQQAVEGQVSDFYKLTRGATVIINGGTGAVLSLLKRITSTTPSSLKDSVAVWGPHTEALSPNTWRLTVTRTSPDHYSYVLEGKPKSADDSAYVAVLSGTHVNAGQENDGNGEFLLDWDAASTLPEHDNNVGTADVTYARDLNTHVITISAEFTNVRDGDTGNTISAQYGYSQTPGVGGTFDFSTNKNVDSDPSRSAAEHLSIRSRWNTDGAGRADVKVSGGDLGTNQATGNECWDANFISRYLNVSYDSSLDYGTEATDCVFTSADYSTL